eukprot:scaffold14068_cov119-Isochrysis_galbana.AAC.17
MYCDIQTSNAQEHGGQFSRARTMSAGWGGACNHASKASPSWRKATRPRNADVLIRCFSAVAARPQLWSVLSSLLRARLATFSLSSRRSAA